MPHRILVHDVPAHVEHERRTTMGLRGDDWYATYHTWEEINERLDQLVAANPGVVHALNVGTTSEGRTIQGVRIGTSDEGIKPAVLFNGCQHAREWVATMVPTFIADELAAGYGVDPRVTALIELVDVYIIPVVNPDGYIHTYEEGGNRFWRKNRRDNGTTCLGVDLNRNWDIDWNGGESTSTDTCSDVYVGTAPSPSPRAVRCGTSFRPSEHRAHIDFHNYSQVILQNWGDQRPDQEAIDALGEAGGHPGRQRLQLSPRRRRRAPLPRQRRVPRLTYDATGAFGYTIELRPTGSLASSPEEIRPTAEEKSRASWR